MYLFGEFKMTEKLTISHSTLVQLKKPFVVLTYNNLYRSNNCLFVQVLQKLIVSPFLQESLFMGYSERCPPPISMQIKSSPSPLVLSMSLPNNFKHPNLLLRCTRTFMGYKL